MSRPPWQADHELDADGARERLLATFPDLAPRVVSFFAEGWDFRMFLVDGAWLFRFPKREGEVLRLEREVALLDLLADRLPVAVPRYEFRAPGVAGYRKLEGGHMIGRVPTSAFAPTLAAFATALHAIDPGDLVLPGEQDKNGGYAQLRIDVADGLEKARPELDPDLHDRCAAALGPAPALDGIPPRLVHNDIYPEHILLDDGGGVCAVIDWGDAYRADPAGDLAVAFFWGGASLGRAAIESYALPVDDGFEARARFGGACMAVSHITYGARTGKTDYLETGVAALDRLA